MASGLETEHFYFFGFLSKKGSEGKTSLEKLKDREETLIFYESPHHIKKTLEVMLEVFGNRNAVIARELTKLNEEYIRGTLKELNEIDESTLKGEMVVLIQGNKSSNDEICDEVIIERLKYYLAYKIDKKTAIELVKNDLQVGKNRVYKYVYEKLNVQASTTYKNLIKKLSFITSSTKVADEKYLSIYKSILERIIRDFSGELSFNDIKLPVKSMKYKKASEIAASNSKSISDDFVRLLNIERNV